MRCHAIILVKVRLLRRIPVCDRRHRCIERTGVGVQLMVWIVVIKARCVAQIVLRHGLTKGVLMVR